MFSKFPGDARKQSVGIHSHVGLSAHDNRKISEGPCWRIEWIWAREIAPEEETPRSRESAVRVLWRSRLCKALIDDQAFPTHAVRIQYCTRCKLCGVMKGDSATAAYELSHAQRATCRLILRGIYQGGLLATIQDQDQAATRPLMDAVWQPKTSHARQGRSRPRRRPHKNLKRGRRNASEEPVVRTRSR